MKEKKKKVMQVCPQCAQVDGGFVARSGGDWLNNKSRVKKDFTFSSSSSSRTRRVEEPLALPLR